MLLAWATVNCEKVAPFTGAWIETATLPAACQTRQVAPFTGAWIETFRLLLYLMVTPCRPLHGGVD